MNRRQFFKSLGQKSIFAVLVGISGILLLKKGNGESCQYDFACKNCKQLRSCNFPEAVKFRTTRIKQNT